MFTCHVMYLQLLLLNFNNITWLLIYEIFLYSGITIIPKSCCPDFVVALSSKSGAYAGEYIQFGNPS